MHGNAKQCRTFRLNIKRCGINSEKMPRFFKNLKSLRLQLGLRWFWQFVSLFAAVARQKCHLTEYWLHLFFILFNYYSHILQCLTCSFIEMREKTTTFPYFFKSCDTITQPSSYHGSTHQLTLPSSVTTITQQHHLHHNQQPKTLFKFEYTQYIQIWCLQLYILFMKYILKYVCNEL